MHFHPLALTAMLASATLLTIAACGGGGGGDAPANSAGLNQGTFVDATTAGLSYTCGSSSGTTDAAGHFNYPSGSTCTFKVGGITLGSTAGAATVTPVALVPGQTTKTTAPSPTSCAC